jgi:hypothetical protein
MTRVVPLERELAVTFRFFPRGQPPETRLTEGKRNEHKEAARTGHGADRPGRVVAQSGLRRAVTLDPSLCAPVINRFTLRIDNPYFPLQEEQRSVLQGEEDGELIGLRITVLGR